MVAFPMIPHTLVLEPGLRVYKIYDGYWFFGRPNRGGAAPRLACRAAAVPTAHVRQHERMTARDQEVEAEARAFNVGPESPIVRHFLHAEPPSKPLRLVDQSEHHSAYSQ
jgi:hypothetical protein